MSHDAAKEAISHEAGTELQGPWLEGLTSRTSNAAAAHKMSFLHFTAYCECMHGLGVRHYDVTGEQESG
jgi:hypothetical protein